MEYIVYRRFKGKAINGIVNLSYGTKCYTVGNLLVTGTTPLCLITSENAHQYFARNDDQNGVKRGELIIKIQNKLKLKNGGDGQKAIADRNAIWQRVWDDTLCQKYKRVEFDDFWLWNHEFYNAPIEDLEYIYSLLLK